MAAPSLVALRCRTAERAGGAPRAAALVAERLGRRLEADARAIGTSEEPREAPWQEDLAAVRGCLLEAGGQVDDALGAGRTPVLVTSGCAVGLTTLAAAARHRSETRFLWLDGHGDFNTPETTTTGSLGGMALAGACGSWDAGLADPVDPGRVVLTGVRDLEPGERQTLEASEVTVIGASLETLVFTQNALDRSPVFVHLDLDVLDPQAFPAARPADGGLAPEKLYDLLEAVAGQCELIGLEVVASAAPLDEREADAAAATAAEVLEPLLAVVADPDGATGAQAEIRS